MTNWFKYTVISLLFVTVMLFMVALTTRGHTNITATQEVEGALQSANVGEIRDNVSDTMDKKTIASNLMLSIAESHKEQNMDVKVNYVFLDDNGSVTENESQINSVQFEVAIIDDEGRVQSRSKQRVALDRLN